MDNPGITTFDCLWKNMEFWIWTKKYAFHRRYNASMRFRNLHKGFFQLAWSLAFPRNGVHNGTLLRFIIWQLYIEWRSIIRWSAISSKSRWSPPVPSLWSDMLLKTTSRSCILQLCTM